MRTALTWAMLALLFPAFAVAKSLAPGSGYVAMGSSYAAGPWIAQSADTPPNRCARSDANYAHLLAGRLHLALTDVTCSGARAVHILQAWDEVPAQIDAVTAQTRLVTITVGGNDLNYLGTVMAMTCPRIPPEQARAIFQGPCPPVKLHTAEDEAHLAQTLHTAITMIHTRAPQARVILVQYFTLFAPGEICPQTGLTEPEQQALRGVAAHLSDITARAAHDTHAEIAPVDALSRAHAICSATPWVNGNHADRANNDGTYYHPNAAGMAAVADVLAGFLG